MSTQELINQAQERKYTEFDIKAKEMLQHKVAQAMQEKGYFDRLDTAQNAPEAPAIEESEESGDE